MPSLVVHRYREQRDRPDLTLPETLQLYLETRFEQLKVHDVCTLCHHSSGERMVALAALVACACTSRTRQVCLAFRKQ